MRPDQYDPLPRVFWSSLIAVGIVALLVALLLPAIQQSREIVSYGPTCKTNLKQIGLALHNYHDDYLYFPAQASHEPACSWRVTLLPYLEHEDLYEEYDRTQDWRAGVNWPVALQPARRYLCPTNPEFKNAEQAFLTSYSMPVGEGTAFRGTQMPKLSDITDGASNTLFVVEACDLKIIWTEPRDVPLDASRLGVNQVSGKPGDPPPAISSIHANGANVLLGDGAARFLSEKIDPEILRRLLLARDGLPVGKF